MNLFSKKDIKSILSKNKREPSKKLGQNFLVNEKIVDKMIEKTNISKEDVILEIGPGIGVLTKKLLLTKAKNVIAIEKDTWMVDFLKTNLKNFSLKIIEGNFLDLNLDKLPPSLKVVSNLPFYVATPMIRKLANCNKVKSMTLIVQKEVAKRIEAKDKNSFLSTILGLKTSSEVIKKVPKSFFWPKPRVDGAIIRIKPHNKYPKDEEFYNNFFKVVEAGFRHSRKQIKNNLKHLKGFSKEEIIKIIKNSKIDPKSRPETLNVEDWVRLTKQFDFNRKRK